MLLTSDLPLAGEDKLVRVDVKKLVGELQPDRPSLESSSISIRRGYRLDAGRIKY